MIVMGHFPSYWAVFFVGVGMCFLYLGWGALHSAPGWHTRRLEAGLVALSSSGKSIGHGPVIDMNHDDLAIAVQGGAPKTAKLVYNSNNYGLWYL